MKLFVFGQESNNGLLHVNEVLDELVVIEASSIDEAWSKAITLGIYKGYRDSDCDHCAARWYGPREAIVVSDEDVSSAWPRSAKFHHVNGNIETKECVHFRGKIRIL